jgi:hypothetical protein
MAKKKSDSDQVHIPVAVVVAKPVKSAKGKVQVNAEETGNGAKAAATGTARSISWSTLLFPALSFISGVMAPPLQYYVSVSFQNEMCFYCETSLTANIEVDHFLPFSKHTDDALDNLVASCKKCNGSKSDSYPSVHHLKKWWTRFHEGTEVFNALNHISEETSHLRDPQATASKARAVYLNKSEGALLWHAVGEMVPLFTAEVEVALLA